MKKVMIMTWVCQTLKMWTLFNNNPGEHYFTATDFCKGLEAST